MRCGLCNYCLETDGRPEDGTLIELRWDKKEKMYVCSDCDGSVYESLSEFDDPFLEGLEVLEEYDVEEDFDSDPAE